LPAPDWRTFYARRARRILPAYYVQLVFLFFVVLPLLFPRLWVQSTPMVVGNLGAHATFLHYTNPLTSASMTVNGALWTLAIEMQYYVLVPLVAPLFVKWPWRSLVGAFLIAAGWRWLSDHHMDWLVAAYLKMVAHAGVTEAGIRHLLGMQLPAWAVHFSLGILAGRAWMLRRNKVIGGIGRWVPVVVAAASVLGLYAVLRNGTSLIGQLGWVAFPVVLAAGFAAIVSWPSVGLSKVVASWPLSSVGRISYSAYLYHLPLLLLFNAFLPSVTGGFAPILWAAIVLLVSAASFQLVERRYLSRGVSCDTPAKVAPAA
jgi:peptidoglycan/LPS O-acetylase OafA/YrhL